jgi:hypothetical protein
MHVLGVARLKGLRRLHVGIEYFLIVRGRNMATQVKERVHVCQMPSIIGKCEQIFNEKLVVNALNLSTESYTGCSALG